MPGRSCWAAQGCHSPSNTRNWALWRQHTCLRQRVPSLALHKQNNGSAFSNLGLSWPQFRLKILKFFLPHSFPPSPPKPIIIDSLQHERRQPMSKAPLVAIHSLKQAQAKRLNCSLPFSCTPTLLPSITLQTHLPFGSIEPPKWRQPISNEV